MTSKPVPIIDYPFCKPVSLYFLIKSTIIVLESIISRPSLVTMHTNLVLFSLLHFLSHWNALNRSPLNLCLSKECKFKSQSRLIRKVTHICTIYHLCHPSIQSSNTAHVFFSFSLCFLLPVALFNLYWLSFACSLYRYGAASYERLSSNTVHISYHFSLSFLTSSSFASQPMLTVSWLSNSSLHAPSLPRNQLLYHIYRVSYLCSHLTCFPFCCSPQSSYCPMPVNLPRTYASHFPQISIIIFYFSPALFSYSFFPWSMFLLSQNFILGPLSSLHTCLHLRSTHLFNIDSCFVSSALLSHIVLSSASLFNFCPSAFPALLICFLSPLNLHPGSSFIPCIAFCLAAWQPLSLS